MKRFYVLITIVMISLLPAHARSADLVFMVLDANSYVANLAVSGLGTKVDIRIITGDDTVREPAAMTAAINGASLIVVDVMGRELESFLTEQVRPKGKTIYALRGSLDDQSLKKKGFIFDPEVAGYYRHLSVVNIQNMLRLVIHRHLDSSVSYGPVA
ncbi:MAG: cobaltochelatase subunit CobN, partial [Desulfobacterales bacterium]|nr:cobaltochelatase subunit CobN [Desulfobacterales bacterium]